MHSSHDEVVERVPRVAEALEREARPLRGQLRRRVGRIRLVSMLAASLPLAHGRGARIAFLNFLPEGNPAWLISLFPFPYKVKVVEEPVNIF